MSAVRPSTRLERRVGEVVAVQIGAAVLFTVLSFSRGIGFGQPWRVGALAAAFALMGSFDMTLELRRHNFTFTLTEAVLVIGLFAVGPAGVGVAAAIGEAVDMAVQRHAFIKAAFNVSNRLAAATIAGAAFVALGYTDPQDLRGWGAALIAAVCFSVLDVVATASVLSIVERSRFHDVFVSSASTGVLATLASAPVGLIAIDLTDRGPAALLFIAPLAVAVACNSRYAVRQRDEHLRFERLYESLARTAGLVALEDALGALAAEARALGTGSAAFCFVTGLDESWIGARADDVGFAPADSRVVATAVALADAMPAGTCDTLDADALGAIEPGARSATVLSSRHENGRRIVLIVVRDTSATPAATSRIETLEAFTYQASLIVSNALLHEDLAVALARQIDLNRQKSDFVAAVSHELRTPLGVMLGSVHTLERLHGRMTDAQRDQLFDMTLDQGTRLQRLIDELLLVAAAEHAELPSELEQLHLGELLDVIETGASTAVRSRLRTETDEHTVVLDRSKVERILFNLVENAGKYGGDGPVEITARRDGATVIFTVADHGPGISAADRERVFERFVQLDQSSTRRQGGTGLGLHLCRQLTDLLGGTLDLSDTPGGGCTFTLAVPTAPGSSVTAPAAPAPSVRVRPGGHHVQRERVR